MCSDALGGCAPSLQQRPARAAELHLLQQEAMQKGIANPCSAHINNPEFLPINAVTAANRRESMRWLVKLSVAHRDASASVKSSMTCLEMVATSAHIAHARWSQWLLKAAAGIEHLQIHGSKTTAAA